MKDLKRGSSSGLPFSGLSATVFGIVAFIVLLGVPGYAAADDCVALGGADGVECVISGVVPGAKTGVFNLAKTLHFTAGGRLKVGATGITININAGQFIMDNNTLIDGNNTPNGAPITVALASGDVNLKTGSTVRSNGGAGGFIQITTTATRVVDIDGLVESVGKNSGTGGNQPPGGGPIAIKAGCELTISDTGVVSSRGGDAGADLVHLEGCVVNVVGLVESTGRGHGIPNNPANSCSDAPTISPRRNPVTRPGKPQNSSGCVEIWAGSTLTIDSTGTHAGEVGADIGIAGGSGGRGWIELLAFGKIAIIDGSGNNHGPTATFAVHANGGIQQNTDNGGLINITSVKSDVTATGDAIRADAITSGSKGGEIVIQAGQSIALDGSGAAIFARGDFKSSGGFGSGGKIGLLAQPIRAFSGFIDWPAGGVGDARPTGSLVPAAQRGEINLQACTGVTLGAAFPVNGAVVPSYPNILAPVCGGDPGLPGYATPFPAADCDTTCNLPGGGALKRGQKFNDLIGDGVKDPGDPGLPNWTIKAFDPVTLVEAASTTTDASGNYQFDLSPGSYVVCEVFQPNWTQTFPAAGAGIVSCASFGANLAPLGYAITLVQGQVDDGNDFGNHLVPPGCPEDPLAKVTIAVDPSGAPHGGAQVFATVQAAWNAAGNGAVIGMFGNTTENVELAGDKTVTITQCTAARVTALDSSKPVWKVNGSGVVTIIGPDAVGGTVGWLVVSGDNDLRGVRASGASQYGIQITGNNNALSFNSVTGSPVGVRIAGQGNDVRGGTVSGNSGNGVEVAAGPNNKFRTANVRTNGGNGVQVDGSGNFVQDNSRIDNNSLNGVLINGHNNTIKNNAAGSDKVKGNGGDGFRVVGTGNTLDGNKANADTGNGFNITSTASGTRLKSNQSNQGSAGGAEENGLAEYRLNATAMDLGGNKADNESVPSAAKCSTFPNAGTVCE